MTIIKLKKTIITFLKKSSNLMKNYFLEYFKISIEIIT